MTRKARIESPDIIKDLRVRFIDFDQAAHQALASCEAHIRATDAWLTHEQRLFLKLQLRKAEERLLVCQREYSQARWSASDLNRSSGMEEKRALDRAKRHKEEVERRIAALEKWTVRLEEQVGKLKRPLVALSNLLDHSTPRALARIDQMLDSLEDYMRPATPDER